MMIRGRIRYYIHCLPPEGEESEVPVVITYKVSSIKNGIVIDSFMDEVSVSTYKCKLKK